MLIFFQRREICFEWKNIHCQKGIYVYIFFKSLVFRESNCLFCLSEKKTLMNTLLVQKVNVLFIFHTFLPHNATVKISRSKFRLGAQGNLKKSAQGDSLWNAITNIAFTSVSDTCEKYSAFHAYSLAVVSKHSINNTNIAIPSTRLGRLRTRRNRCTPEMSFKWNFVHEAFSFSRVLVGRKISWRPPGPSTRGT